MCFLPHTNMHLHVQSRSKLQYIINPVDLNWFFPAKERSRNRLFYLIPPLHSTKWGHPCCWKTDGPRSQIPDRSVTPGPMKINESPSFPRQHHAPPDIWKGLRLKGLRTLQPAQWHCQRCARQKCPIGEPTCPHIHYEKCIISELQVPSTISCLVHHKGHATEDITTWY